VTDIDRGADTHTAAQPCTWLRQQGLLIEEMASGSAGVASDVATGIAAEIDAHLGTCAACASLHADIAQLRTQIGRLPASPPPPGWQRAVWAQIAAKRQSSWRASWQKWAAGILVPVAAAVMLAIVVKAARPRSDAVAPMLNADAVMLAFVFEPDANRPRTRGDVAVGDTVIFQATATAPLPPATELRVYRDDAGVVLRCSDQPPCQRQGKNLRVRMPITAIGRYRAMIVVSAIALPAPTGFLDDDLAALSRVPGATWRWASTIDIW
jgi:hypothetical protein